MTSSRDAEREARIANMMAKYPHIDRHEAAFRVFLTTPTPDLAIEEVEKETQVVLLGQSSDDDTDSDIILDDSDEEDDIDMDSSDNETSETDEQDDIFPGAGAMITSNSLSTSMPAISSTLEPSVAPPPTSSTQRASELYYPTEERLQQYLDSVKLMYYTLAVVRIIYESYVTAHHQINAPEIQSHQIPYPEPKPSPTLIEHLLGIVGCPVPLLSLQDLESYGISFPSITSPPPPMPQTFVLRPPRPRRRVIEPTQNAAPPDIVENGPDWERIKKIRKLMETLELPRQSTYSSTGALNVPFPPPGAPTSVLGNSIVASQPNDIRKVKRVIKPLPKRVQGLPVVHVSNQTAGSTTVVESVVETAMGVGLAIASGVKRLRSELEEGGLGRWKILRTG